MKYSIEELRALDNVIVPRTPTAQMLEEAWADALAEDAAGVWREMIASIPSKLNNALPDLLDLLEEARELAKFYGVGHMYAKDCHCEYCRDSGTKAHAFLNKLKKEKETA